MRRIRAALGTLVFLFLAPGVVAGLVPWGLTGWRTGGAPLWLQVVGWIAVVVAATVLLESFARFVVEGVGTPAPVAPTERLVVGGLYRYVRNPIYLAVATAILGQAAVLGRWVLVVYALVFGAAAWSFVRLYEEPTLRRGSVLSTSTISTQFQAGGHGVRARLRTDREQTPFSLGMARRRAYGSLGG